MTGPTGGATWDLTQLFASDKVALRAARELVWRAQDLAQGYRGRVAALAPKDLEAAIGAVETIEAEATAIQSYAKLRVAADTRDDVATAFRASLRVPLRQVHRHIKSFDEEIVGLGRDKLIKLSAEKDLGPHAHYLERLADRAGHSIPSETERVLQLRTPLVRHWQSLHRMILGSLLIPTHPDRDSQGQTVSLEAALSLLASPDLTTRRNVAHAIHESAQPHLRTLALAYDAIVTDRWAMARAYGFGHPLEVCADTNELPAGRTLEIVNGVSDHSDLARVWYDRKKQLLGLETLTTADLSAAIPDAPALSFDEAMKMIAEGLGAWFPRGLDRLQAIIRERRIDVEARPGRQTGTFCQRVAPGKPSFIQARFTGTIRDLAGIAHECGHALHYAYSAQQSARQSRPNKFLAEIAALTFETMVMDALNTLLTGRLQAELANQQLSAIVGAVFDEAWHTAFEHDIHGARDPDNPRVALLSVEFLNEAYSRHSFEHLGNAVATIEGDGDLWALLPHFFGKGYSTYPYVVAQLVALVVAGRGAALADDFERFLALGGSQSSVEAAARLGIDLEADDWLGFAFQSLADRVASHKNK